ncbi:MAG: hypothetical protein HXX17_07975 [Geobacteraceae bacterium]|nr:hypothetical protein [Geobacteraceae bacterium]
MTETTLRDDVAEAARIVSAQEVLRINAKAKVARYTLHQCIHGIADAHDTLQVGQYEYSHPYAQKLWAEIDAMRDRQRFLAKC